MNPQAIAQAYIDTWNAPDQTSREALLASHWTSDAAYRDPLADVHGAAAIASLVASAQKQFAGFRFTLSQPANGYGDVVRLAWTLGPDGAPPPIEGSDVLVLTDGKIAQVIGFLDKVP